MSILHHAPAAVHPVSAFAVCPYCVADAPCRVCGSSGWVEANPTPFHEWRLPDLDVATVARRVVQALHVGLAPHPDDLEVARAWYGVSRLPGEDGDDGLDESDLARCGAGGGHYYGPGHDGE